MKVSLKNCQLYERLFSSSTMDPTAEVCSRESLHTFEIVATVGLVQVLLPAQVVPPLPAFKQWIENNQ